MEIDCENIEIIKIARFVSCSDYSFYTSWTTPSLSPARLLHLRYGSSVRCSEQNHRKVVTQS